MNITKDIRYVGVTDRNIDLFEGQYQVPQGMLYNSYIIMDEKTAVTDTVDAKFVSEWLENIEKLLQGRAPDYLIVHHMEPDHSAGIDRFLKTYPTAKVVAGAKAFAMMRQFFGNEYADRRVVVGEGDTLKLGRHTLRFIAAPMVHWPEVMVSFEETEGILFSADAFGKFGAQKEASDWTEEARRYYIGIVGKYGAQATALLKKAAGLKINMICPLHGPVLRENLGQYMALYQTWASYTPEQSGVVIAYTSVYGNTRAAALLLSHKLELLEQKVVCFDLARCDMPQAVAAAFQYDRLVLASPTYNADIFPPMRTFITALCERNFQNRTVALIENGSWAPCAAKVMRGMLEKCKSLTIMEEDVRILSRPNVKDEAALTALAERLCC